MASRPAGGMATDLPGRDEGSPPRVSWRRVDLRRNRYTNNRDIDKKIRLMSGYTQTSFWEILDGVRGAREWYEQIGISTARTRIEDLEHVLDEFTRDLETSSPEEVVAKWDWRNDQRAYYTLSDGVGFTNIHERNWETYPRTSFREMHSNAHLEAHSARLVKIHLPLKVETFFLS